MTIDALEEFIKAALSAPAKLAGKVSFARALKIAIMSGVTVDGMTFLRADQQEPDDSGLTGRHVLIMELLGRGKTYRVTIEPVEETHR